MRSFALSSVADAGAKKSGTAYCSAKGLKCLSVDRLWTKADGWRGFESNGGDWYAYGCDKELLTDADLDGKAKVVHCYGQAATSSSDQIQLFGIQTGLTPGQRHRRLLQEAKDSPQQASDWLLAEKGRVGRALQLLQEFEQVVVRVWYPQHAALALQQCQCIPRRRWGVGAPGLLHRSRQTKSTAAPMPSTNTTSTQRARSEARVPASCVRSGV